MKINIENNLPQQTTNYNILGCRLAGTFQLYTKRHYINIHTTQSVPKMIHNFNCQILISVNSDECIQFAFLLRIYPIVAVVQKTIFWDYITNSFLSLFSKSVLTTF